MNVPELLAPAGSFASAEAAFAHGADAVYAGIGNFNLRAHSPNFSVDEFAELLKFANDNNKKAYAVLNIMPNDEMLSPLENMLKQLADNDIIPHAFIISDPGVLSLVKKIFVDDVCDTKIKIHLSTQSGCFNSASMKFWRDLGISRVILPRELNVDQIAQLSSLQIMETEIFAHGAMCVSVSGRCLLGAYYNKRHPNLGDCPQPCRFKYKIIPLAEDGVIAHDGFEVEEICDDIFRNDKSRGDKSCANNFCNDKSSNNVFRNGAYLLNSKDLCTIEILPQLLSANVSSLKIEGRNKSAHYVASVVKVYRDAIDTYINDPDNYSVKNWWREELDAIEHRPYTTGFYADDPIKQELFSSKAHAGYKLIGIVKAVKNNRPIIDVKNTFAKTPINILPVKRGQTPFDLSFDTIKEFDDAETTCGRARANRLVLLDGCSEKLRVGDMLRVAV